jgi:hypothetical protein
MSFQRSLDQSTLDALPAAVNQANLPQSGGCRGPHVLLGDGHDIARVKGMQVDGIFDRDVAGHGKNLPVATI